MNGALEQILTPSIRPLLAASSIGAEKASAHDHEQKVSRGVGHQSTHNLNQNKVIP